jgi:serine/threonine protein kinase/tetratricopeptide (TPR) repeat protein
MSKSPVPPTPKEIAQFGIRRRLGAGGMAEVFLAEKRGAEGTVKLLVLKRILPSHGSSRRFRTMFVEEANLATRLNHPNVVQVYEFQDAADDGLLLAMEYVEGCDLGRLMSSSRSKGTRIPPWLGAWIIGEASKGLHYAHEKKDEEGKPLEIVHRDVSPQNILLSFDGAVKIADFGIASARVFAEDSGVLKGKFGYMSPEQARGEGVDRRSDLYALGVIFWEILTGRPLHGGLGGEALLDIVRSGIFEPPTTYVEDIPQELDEIVHKALSPNREERYATGRELAAAIGKSIVKQGELIDASTLESALATLVPRDARARESAPPPSLERDQRSRSGHDVRTQAAVPLARSSPEAPLSSRALPSLPSVEGLSLDSGAISLPGSLPIVPDGPREVRHVAVLTLRLQGVGASSRAFDQLRSMLDDLAFKRGMHWVWSMAASLESPGSAPLEGDRPEQDVGRKPRAGSRPQQDVATARAIAGLTSNPGRAASEASHLALDVHETIGGFKDDLATTLTASIGIVRGIASGVRDAQGHLVRYSLHEPVNYLANLLGLATPAGRTWVAGGIYRLVRRDFRWGDAPNLQVDPDGTAALGAGVEMPPSMRVYALERSLSRDERLTETQGASSDLVGRDAEKADLHASFHAAVRGSNGNGQLVSRAVVGEMGIGKTALVGTFLAELPPHARVVHVECTPVKMEVPFGGIAELVRSAIGTTGEEPLDEVAALIARAGGGTGGDPSNPMVARLAELATNHNLGGGDEDAHTRRKFILAGVRNLLAAIALVQPVVLVVESMQWADRASLDVLGEFVHASDPLPIFVLLVTRLDDRVHHVLDGVVRVELRGLTTDEQLRLVETRLGVRDGARQVCSDLLPKVAGNPFFLLEMIDALLERGALEIRETQSEAGETVAVLARTERADAGAGTLPSTLEQLLGDRIRELPVEEHAVVDWLAVAGGPLPVGDVLTLTLRDSDEAIVRLCARGLCDRKGEQVDFRHPLTRDVAYAELDSAERVRMHRSLGEHLAETSLARGLSAAIVARHLARGRSDDRAAELYFEAANAARLSHQTRLWIRYTLRALSLLGENDPRRVQAHEALESAYRMLGRRRERLRHLHALRAIVRVVGTPRAVCLGLLRSARYDFDEGHLGRGVQLALRAAEVAHQSKVRALEVEAEALVSDFLRELGDVQGALAACDRALADPARAARVPPRLQGEVLLSRGVLLRRVGRVREAVDAYVEAIAIFRKCGVRRLEARVKNALAYAMFVQGRYEDAVALAIESIQIDLSVGGRFQIAKTLTNVGHSYFRLGDVPRALAYLARAREGHERYSDQDGRVETLLVSALVAIELGELDQAEGFLRDAGALNAATENAYDRANEQLVRALLAGARREPQAAVGHALEARHAAERMALVAIHFYAMAIEASARVDMGEMHAATLVATTALGAVENLQGCEYGLEIRSLCADALKRAGSPQAAHAHQRAVDYAESLARMVRDSRLRKLLPRRPAHAALFETTPLPSSVRGSSSEPPRPSTPPLAPPAAAHRRAAKPS